MLPPEWRRLRNRSHVFPPDDERTTCNIVERTVAHWIRHRHVRIDDHDAQDRNADRERGAGLQWQAAFESDREECERERNADRHEPAHRGGRHRERLAVRIDDADAEHELAGRIPAADGTVAGDVVQRDQRRYHGVARPRRRVCEQTRNDERRQRDDDEVNHARQEPRTQRREHWRRRVSGRSGVRHPVSSVRG